MDSLALSTIAGVASLLLVAFTANELSSKHPGDVRVVWYLFSLAIVISFLLAMWARHIGAIDDAGGFHGTAGQVISHLLKLALDIKSSLLLGLGIMVLVFAPQVLSYLLSGLTGCAASPIFLGGTLRFVTWGFVKTFAVASGVIINVSLCAQLDSWGDWSITQTFSSLLLSAMLIADAFVILYVYRGMPLLPALAYRLCPQTVVCWARSAKKWLTRKSQEAQ